MGPLSMLLRFSYEKPIHDWSLRLAASLYHMVRLCISCSLPAFTGTLDLGAARKEDQMPMLEAFGWLMRFFWDTITGAFRRIWHEYKM